MLFLIGYLIAFIIIIAIIANSKKNVTVILAQVKYGIIYNYVGFNALLQDFNMKEKNRTDLSIKSGKVAVITGGTRGIGLEVIKMLLKCDMTVIIGCRDVGRAKVLINQLRAEGYTIGKIDIWSLDISVMDSVKQFASAVREKYHEIHYLVNNAGIMFGPYSETIDKYESQFATNYLGHFLLTHFLLPQLKAAGKKNSKARIVNVSSCAHVVGEINFMDINSRENYVAAKAYAQSKLGQVLFTKYLDKLLRNEKVNVQVHSVHPGIVNTELFNGTLLKTLAPWIPPLLFKNAKQGAIPIVHACLSSELEGKGGTYIHNCQIFPTSKLADNIELQKKMYDFTKDLLKINDNDKLDFLYHRRD